MKIILYGSLSLALLLFGYAAHSQSLIWAKSMGSTSLDRGACIKTDAAGNVYTTGVFYGNADFDPSASGTFNLTSAGNGDIFISKLDASGNFLWAKSMGGDGYDFGYSFALDASSNVYTTGYFNGTADFDPSATGIFNLTSPAGNNDIYIHKMSNPTSIRGLNNQLAQNIKIYPNPSAGKINLSLSNPIVGSYTLTLTDMLGKKITLYAGHKLSEELDQTLDLSSLPKGVYRVEWECKDQKTVQRFVKL